MDDMIFLNLPVWRPRTRRHHVHDPACSIPGPHHHITVQATARATGWVSTRLPHHGSMAV